MPKSSFRNVTFSWGAFDFMSETDLKQAEFGRNKKLQCFFNLREVTRISKNVKAVIKLSDPY